MSDSDVARPALHEHHGVRVSVEELRSLRGDAMRLGTAPADALGSLFPGAYRATVQGRGVEYDETRGYHWGDDSRSLDWRVTARTGRLHTKLFHEERERTLYLVVDAGPTMQFGSRVQFKWVLAARLAALFGWLALECGDRLGGVVFGDGAKPHIRRPGSGEMALNKLFHLLSRLPPDPGEQAESASGLSDALKHVRQLARPGSLVLMLSDFCSLDGSEGRHLGHLNRHNELAAIQLFDPLEAALPPAGLYPLSDGTREALLDSRSRQLRDAYNGDFRVSREALFASLRRYGVKPFAMATDQPLVTGLRDILRGRP